LTPDAIAKAMRDLRSFSIDEAVAKLAGVRPEQAS
jgi:hypothetical protein